MNTNSASLLVPVLRDSELYARMEMKVLSAFTSKYALSLYEALAARVNLRKTMETIDLATYAPLAAVLCPENSSQ